MGWGASNTTGGSPSKISISRSPNTPLRQGPNANAPTWGPNGMITPAVNANPMDDMSQSRGRIQESNRSQRQMEIANNPNFFYNEDFYLQQALQQSLVETHGTSNQQSSEQTFNQLLKDTIILSKKEYDDIDRKVRDDEIQKIKDDPIAMKKKLENLLSKERVTTQGKKLPPLAAINNVKSNKPKEKKDLSLIKAPILLNNQQPMVTQTEAIMTNRLGNDTDSDLDMKEQHIIEEPKAPSYNPRLLKNDDFEDKFDKNNMFSLESNEYEEDAKFARPNNQITNEDEDYHNLIADLDEEPDYKIKRKNLPSGQDSTMDQKRNKSKIIEDKRDLDDSFDELIDNFGNNVVPVTKKTVVKQPLEESDMKNSLDDFEF